MSLDARTRESPPVGGVEELVAWFRARERPRESWKVGLEHEKLLAARRDARAGRLRGPRRRRGGAARVHGASATSRSRRTAGSSPPRTRGSPSRSSPAVRSSSRGARSPTCTSSPRSSTGTSRSAPRLARDLGARVPRRRLPALGHARRRRPWMPKKRYEVMRPFLAARGPARAGHDGDDRLRAGVVRLLRRERSRGEAARRARHPAGRDGALRELSPIVNGREVGLEELPRRRVGGDGPRALRDPPVRLRARASRRTRTAATRSGRSTSR